jgi:hypothetical protein
MEGGLAGSPQRRAGEGVGESAGVGAEAMEMGAVGVGTGWRGDFWQAARHATATHVPPISKYDRSTRPFLLIRLASSR